MLETTVLLFAVHFICDYVLQTDSIARGKNHLLQKQLYGVDWYYWLVSHSFTHAVGVYLVTQNVYLLVAELVIHTLVDYTKCNKKLTLHQDQGLHLLCKVMYLPFV